MGDGLPPRSGVEPGMTHPYEQDLGALCLTRAPAQLDDDDAALALIAHCPDISAARIKHGLACRQPRQGTRAGPTRTSPR